MPPLRIYAETLPFADVTRPSTLRLLARYGLEIVLAVRPWQKAELPAAAAALRDAGVRLSVWPMLGDDEGRWASTANAPAFVAFVDEILDGSASAGGTSDVLFDLEPSFERASALARRAAWEGIVGLASGVARTPKRALFAQAEETFARSIDRLRARGVTASMAVWPLVALDPPGEKKWQALLGTPVDALDAQHVSVMIYTSILEGWSRGVLRRRDAATLLAAGAARALRRWGPRAGLSLGCVGTGAFEDEPVYRSPRELAEDVAIARAAGVSPLSLFDLGGVLARGPAEAWLDAFAFGDEIVRLDPPSRRVTAARTLARAATWALRSARVQVDERE